MITSDQSTWPTGDLVWTVAQAIALAEGANVINSAPDRNNNPGDLSKGDEHGQTVAGYMNLPDGEKAIVFANKMGGWQALYTKLSNILNGSSTSYSPGWTWNQIAKVWAGNSAAWVNNVTRVLGVSPDSVFADYFGGATTSAPSGTL